MSIEQKLEALASALDTVTERLDQAVDDITAITVLVEDMRSEITKNTERED